MQFFGFLFARFGFLRLGLRGFFNHRRRAFWILSFGLSFTSANTLLPTRS